jgi:xanthine dehydrogenase accessory factor
MAMVVLIRGGGDLASGVALRLHRAGLQLLITELPEPLVVRRRVSFAQAIFQGWTTVEEVTARRVDDLTQALKIISRGEIPVLVDPQAESLLELRSVFPIHEPIVLVDGRMIKRPPELSMQAANLVIGLGPGFIAGENCHAVVETQRGYNLGRVLWQGEPERDTGIPDRVTDYGFDRVLRAPTEGVFQAHADIGDHLEAGQLIANVDGAPVRAPFRGVLRGLLYPGLRVQPRLKVGDVDPRDDPRYCMLVSDKSMAIAGGVLEAILSRSELRPFLWD